MNYEAWMKLTEEEMVKVPNSELPEIPKEQLTNFLTSAKMIRVEGELMWEVIQETPTRKTTGQFPLQKKKLVQGQTFWYQFDPTMGTYSLDLEQAEPTTDEEPIGQYGVEWMKNMEKNYPETVDYLRLQHRFLTIARVVDQEANQYMEFLNEQFEQMNPRPTNFEDILKWERARMYYSEGIVMREKVLVMRNV